MEQEELVLRFFALTHEKGYLDYKGQFKNFLTSKMDEFNELEDGVLLTMEKHFKNVFSNIKSKFGSNPFQKYRSVDGDLQLMSNFNAAVFDSVIIAVSNEITSKKGTSEQLQSLFHDSDYFSSVEGSVNDVKKIKTRVDKVSEILK